MFWPLIIFSALLGLAVGSFLNVCILRYGTGSSIAHGRSMCPVCGKKLAWYELIPLFSFIFLGGKCLGCKSRISWQYPIVELFTAILFVLVFLRQYALYPLYSALAHGLLYSVLFVIYYFVIVSLLMIIAIYDLRHKIIPQGPVWTFIILSTAKLALYFFCMHINPLSAPYVYDLIAPVALFIPFWLLWQVSGGRWMGFGDAKLAFGIGALLGMAGGISAVVFGFWIGAAVCIVVVCIKKFFDRFFPGCFSMLGWQSQVPLAPFLVIGTCMVLLLHLYVPGIGYFFNV